MVQIHPVRETDLPTFQRLHNEYMNRNEPLEAVQDWFDKHPNLLIGAYLEGELIGQCLGFPRTDTAVELNGICVKPSFRRQGVGTKLLTEFETQATSVGFDCVTLGSAGGYVDEFYLANGYAPVSILVRSDPDEEGPDEDDHDYTIVEEQRQNDTRKRYIEVEKFDPSELDDVRDTFEDPEAIYIMEKSLNESART